MRRPNQRPIAKAFRAGDEFSVDAERGRDERKRIWFTREKNKKQRTLDQGRWRRPIMKTQSHEESTLNRKTWHCAVVLLVFVPAVLGGLANAHAQAAGAPPERMGYQGYLVDADGVPLAPVNPQNYPIVFRIYDSAQGGDLKWSEQQVVTVDKGNFNVILGEGTPVPGEDDRRPNLSTVFTGSNASERYIEVTVSIGGSNQVITPRLRLLPGPYAFLARHANKLAHPDGFDLVVYAGGQINLAESTAVGGDLYVGGDLTVDGTIRDTSSTSPVDSSEPNLRIVRGTVDFQRTYDGRLYHGSGFSVSRDPGRSGRYTVTFDKPFADSPTAVCSSWGNPAVMANVLRPVTSNSFDVAIWDIGDDTWRQGDGSFTFIAIGVAGNE